MKQQQFSIGLAMLASMVVIPAIAHAQESEDRVPTTLSLAGTLAHTGRLPGRTLLARVGFHPTGSFDYGLQGGFLASRHSSVSQWPNAVGVFGRYYLKTPPTSRYDSYLGEIDLKLRRNYVGVEYFRASDGGDYGGGVLGHQEGKYFFEMRYLRNKFTGSDFSANIGLMLKGM
jgi:hypothetical protein